MDDLKKTLEAMIEDFGVDAILKSLADICAGRAKEIRNIDAKNTWKQAAVSLDRTRLEIDI